MMKFIKQFWIVLVVTFIGEALRYVIPLPVPASIYALVIMLIALQTKIIRLEQVKDIGGFLIEIMPMMFIPAAVGLLVSWESLKNIWLPVTIVTVATTILVMGVTGRMTQFVIRLEKRKCR
jgi:holin-like protein